MQFSFKIVHSLAPLLAVTLDLLRFPSVAVLSFIFTDAFSSGKPIHLRVGQVTFVFLEEFIEDFPL